jgi:cytochrome P450
MSSTRTATAATSRPWPSRWTPGGRESLRQAYLPFGMGPRICIGAAFALQEAALILALVARHVRVEPVPGETPSRWAG